MDRILALRTYVTDSPMKATVIAPPWKPSITITPTLETVAPFPITDVAEMTIDLTLWSCVDVIVNQVGTHQPTVELLQVGQTCYSCGLSTATIEYSCPSVCVCLSVCVHDNSK